MLLSLVAGAVLVVDGALRGELRHRLLAVSLGLLLLGAGLVQRPGRVPRQHRPIRGLGLAVTTGLLTLVMVEFMLRLVGIGPIPDWTFVPSAELGHTVPRAEGVDARGFFNGEALKEADLVCIGDSQTVGLFGPGKRYSDQLAELTGLSIYNMAQGGYGPGQYAVLTESCLELRPRRVVIGFYFGNDLLDAYFFAGLPGREEMRAPGIRYPVYPHLNLKEGVAPNLGMALIDLLVDRTSLGSRSAEVVRSWMKARFGISYHGPDGPRVKEGPLATRLTPAYRYPSVDLGRRSTGDGLRLTRLAFDRIQAVCEPAGIEVDLLFLPTKEFCYAQLVERGLVKVEGLGLLAGAEQAARWAVRRAAEQAGLSVLDPTETLLAAMGDGENPWSPTSDGHFTDTGHRLLAGFLARSLVDGQNSSR